MNIKSIIDYFKKDKIKCEECGKTYYECETCGCPWPSIHEAKVCADWDKIFGAKRHIHKPHKHEEKK